ncbi:TRAFAC clade GTPase domain-containing protein [Thiospirillum jenense]|uniref:50S ribosome-binding GTPase n=1 Tax=Thiospirillum jenense TaxID=1653858 RepID=A0A839HPQ1_9GAMM|nr:GTPase [Thiospirillum jenense]MBB1127162.1 50S ribosome-binding GTPase [Thiospirillum jenense]
MSIGSNVLNITMLGSRGVGKTTLLASMYNEFDKMVKDISLTLTPNQETSSILQQRLAELKRQTEVFSPKRGIDGTNSPKEFIFDLGMVGKTPEIQLRFKDFPGGFIKDNPNEVKKFLSAADVILLAIDAPAMMEAKGIWHEKINTPQMITDLLKHVVQNLDATTKTKLLIMVPVKCESYVQSDNEARKLLQTLKDSYTSLFNLLKADRLLDKFAVVVTPVQTLGSVRFTRIEEVDQGEPRFFFRKVSPSAIYAPRDVDQILRYTLGFCIKKYLDDMSFFKRVLNQLFNMSQAFEQAVRKMAGNARKETDGFQIVQGATLLSRD